MTQIYCQSISRISPLLTNSMAAILVQGTLIACLTLWLASLVSCSCSKAVLLESLSHQSRGSRGRKNVGPHFPPWNLAEFSYCSASHSFCFRILTSASTFSINIFALGFTSSQNALTLEFPRVCCLTFVYSFTSSLRPFVYSF